jgi:fructose-specific component phosphotransferase system IIB-like protein
MKKLLALILCVMMFVSVIPTMAFAEDAPTTDTQKPAAIDYSKYGWIDNPLYAASVYKKEIENMMKNTKEDIENAYAEFASNKSVYSTAKGMDDTIVGLVDAISADIIGKKIVVYDAEGKVTNPEYQFKKADADGIKDQVRLLIDKKVADKMAENEYKFVSKYNDDGSVKEINPIKYAQTFADSVSAVLTDKDFQKGYEAVATYFALASLVKNVNDTLKDEYKAFYGDVDKDFDKDFETKYPELFKSYIDTIAENNPKAFWAWDGVTEYPIVLDNGWDTRS